LKRGYCFATVLAITLFVTVVTGVNGSVQNKNSSQTSFSVASPINVILQPGTQGTATFSTNNTNAQVSVPQAWLINFQYRKKITFNNSAISENLTNFTVPIIFTSSNTDFWGHVQTNGNDTRFVASDNTTELYYEFEQFNHTSDSMIAWVKVPQIDASSTTGYIWVYYGNSTVNFDSYSSNSSNAWDSNYIAVWHLKESPTAPAPQFADSKDGNAGTATNMVAGDQQTGVIDGGLNFNGANASVVTNKGTSVKGLAQYTIEAWANTGVLNGARRDIYEEEVNTSANTRVKLCLDTTNRFALQGRALDGDGYTTWVSPTTTLSINTWYYVAGVFNSSGTHHLMINGSDTTSTVAAHAISNTLPTDTPAIGRKSNSPASEFWSGKIDEVRISKIGRSVNWLKACYQYEADQSKFTYGSEDTFPKPVTYDYVLKVVNQVGSNWTVYLSVYNSSNIGRLSNCTVSFHDGSQSNQILISGGVITQSTGPQYSLPGSSTIYISVNNLQATSTGTSSLYVYLIILPSSMSPFNVLHINFQVT
jgi:hypothetical protein